MPIWLRNFTFNQILDYHKNKNKENTVDESISNMKQAKNLVKTPSFGEPQPKSTYNMNPQKK